MTSQEAPPKGRSIAAAIIAACAICATGITVTSEGLVRVARPDPVGIPTVCFGHTEGVQLGQVESDAECRRLLGRDLEARGAAIARCLPPIVPLKVRAAFTDFAFNAGPAAFCSSRMARLAQAGDLVGACAALSDWSWATKAGRKVQLPGLVKRRAAERALCEAGLGDLP